jgi:gluconate 2-dehydrogenase gamma chain
MRASARVVLPLNRSPFIFVYWSRALYRDGSRIVECAILHPRRMVMTVFISRRELLKRAGLAGAAAAAVPIEVLAAGELASVPAKSAGQAITPPRPRELPENLTAVESDVLEAIVARLIPTDETGPGAAEARAARYIDRALGGALAQFRQAYAAGLAALDSHARQSKGASFARLPAVDQDAALIDVETGVATGFPGSPAAFFNLVRTHTLQGTFGDPYYGGNANFAGWDLIGYPGVRTIVTPDEQRLGGDTPSNHKSAYDYDMFKRA